jgi:alkyl sulfatase BDS1-like metallo-beta-lactamase superfamily hydrolase
VPYPIDLPQSERALRGMALLQSGILGLKNGPPARDPETMALLFDTVRRGVDFRTAPEGPLTVQWDFTDADAWHVVLENGSTSAQRGTASKPDVSLRMSLDDFGDVIAERADPRGLLLRRRVRVRGNPRVLMRLPKVFG